MNNEGKTKKIAHIKSRIYDLYYFCGGGADDDDDTGEVWWEPTPPHDETRVNACTLHERFQFRIQQTAKIQTAFSENSRQSLHLRRARKGKKRRGNARTHDMRSHVCARVNNVCHITSLCKIGLCLISLFGIYLNIKHNNNNKKQNIIRSIFFT